MHEMDSGELFILVCMVWIAASIPTFFYLLKYPAPYGRYSASGWGKMISNKLGWMFMELPVLLIVAGYGVFHFPEITLASKLAIGLFVSHYIYRCFVYPLRLQTTGKQMPLAIAMAAMVFNLINGNIIGLGLTHFYSKEAGQLNAVAVAGLALFVLGLITHIAADGHLISLRKSSSVSGYQIPYAGLFNKVSCPNYLGEIIEWIGFALITNHIAAWSFAIWTAANLVPRAIHHHHWYKTHFKNYPSERRALVPYLL